MPRIRSIHPSFWTDEAVASLSHAARLLFIGLWNLADDKGAFEWKPLSIRMQLFPADDVDVSKLLHELICSDLIRQYDAGSRKFGAVRNFRRYQRPKKPNDIHPMPDVIRQYTFGFSTSSEPVENQSRKVPADGFDSLKEEVPPNARVDPPKKRQPKQNRQNGAQHHAKQPRSGMVAVKLEMMERAHETEPTEQASPHRGRVVDLTGRLNRR